MKKYLVNATRVEHIAFEVEAASEAGAIDRYLGEGEEAGSATASLAVSSVEEVPGG